MSLDHILLGMLKTPASGYDLGQEFEDAARMFWFAELSQIYPTLRRLEKKGFLTSEAVPSDRGPNRRVYHRTAEGERELHRWLRQDPEIKTVRLEYVAQLCFMAELEEPTAPVRFFETLRGGLQVQLARYRAIDDLARRELGDAGDDPPLDDFYRLAALRVGIRVTETRLDWCDEMIQEIEARADLAGALMEVKGR